ncbi:MAG: hypothetical protein ACYCZT_12865, partial [Thiobacillus sp.]
MDFEEMKVSNLGGAAAELPESAECFSAEAAAGDLSRLFPLWIRYQTKARKSTERQLLDISTTGPDPRQS